MLSMRIEESALVELEIGLAMRTPANCYVVLLTALPGNGECRTQTGKEFFCRLWPHSGFGTQRPLEKLLPFRRRIGQMSGKQGEPPVDYGVVHLANRGCRKRMGPG